MRLGFLILALGLVLAALGADSVVKANFPAPVSARQEPLRSMSQASSKDTPVDFMALARILVEEGRFDQALEAFLVASAYIDYDVERVLDSSSHKAGIVLLLYSKPKISKEQENRLMEEGEKFASNPGKMREVLRRFGPPQYFPQYMIAYGKGAQSGGFGDGLVPNFDSNKVWEKILQDCDQKSE